MTDIEFHDIGDRCDRFNVVIVKSVTRMNDQSKLDAIHRRHFDALEFLRLFVRCFLPRLA